MTSLEKKLKEFEKSSRFKELVAKKIKTDANFGSGVKGYGTKEAAKSYGDAMKEFLRNEIIDIRSSVTGESFLDHIIVGESFVTGVGWAVDVSFNEKKVHRDSLYNEGYPDGVQLDEIFNEGYPKIRADVWGEWHGEYTYGLDHRDALYFIQQAVEKFNSKYKGKAVAQYNSKYSGGTL